MPRPGKSKIKMVMDKTEKTGDDCVDTDPTQFNDEVSFMTYIGDDKMRNEVTVSVNCK